VRTICHHFGARSDPALFRYDERPNFPPRYNVAPTQPIPIVRLIDGKRQFALVRWGLIPSWAKDPKTFSLLINARGESAADKPAFRNAMKRRRCLIPADGFYEWKQVGERKRPYYVRPTDGAPWAFAGLWETWTGPNGEELDTAAIVTTTANRTLSTIHDRMPVIVPPEAFDLWLDCNHVDATTASAVIAPAQEDVAEVYEVSTAVNRVANDDVRLTTPAAADAEPPAAEPISEKPARKRAKKEDDGQASLF
jgi:putative SOS response-associated peptidase YedK